jgi:hypothetical protein
VTLLEHAQRHPEVLRVHLPARRRAVAIGMQVQDGAAVRDAPVGAGLVDGDAGKQQRMQNRERTS